MKKNVKYENFDYSIHEPYKIKGLMFRCKIDDILCEGICSTFQAKHLILCQNTLNDMDLGDIDSTYGYDYGWLVYDTKQLRDDYVHELEIEIPEKTENLYKYVIKQE